MYTQFSSTAVDPFASHVVDSLPLEKFTEPVYNQVHQEQIAADKTTENMAEIPVVQEQVIVQEIPEIVDLLPPVEEVYCAPCTTKSIRSSSLQRR